MKLTFVSLAASLALIPLVSGHGWVGWVGIDGRKYDGNVPIGDTVQSPIRTVKHNGPSDPSSGDMACGPQARNAALVADVSPGSTLTIHWAKYDGANWAHDVGPIITYMASCGTTPCDKFDASGAKWFKIAQFGYSDTASRTWWQKLLFTNQPIDVELPINLTPGGYLIRHEVISLQGERAEFYPSCFQVNMVGNGNGTPDSTLAFPGAYDASDYASDVGQFTPEEFYFVGGPLSNLANPDQTPGGTAGVTGVAGGGADTVSNKAQA